MGVEEAKRRAALKALSCVRSGLVIGLGTGSTVNYFIKALGERVKEGLRIKCVPSSLESKYLAIENGLELTSLDIHPQLDLTIDGADQVDSNLNLLKGLGGALTREKILAKAARKLIIIIDERKLVNELGDGKPIPIEVIPFAYKLVCMEVEKIGGKPILRKSSKGKMGPIITDNGNFIIDAYFEEVEDPSELNYELKMIPGVVETGLFLGMTNMVIVGYLDGRVKVLSKG